MDTYYSEKLGSVVTIPGREDEEQVQVAVQALLSTVRPYLHHDGRFAVVNGGMSVEDHLRLFSLGDGYGRMSSEELMANGLAWDWSHIRDSSLPALALIVAELMRIRRR